MARYIDIESAGIGKANREQFLVPEFADGWNAVLEILEKEPTADVVEVKHGEWKVKEFKSTNRKFITCSVCNLVIDSLYHKIDENEFDYCPYCGAKMDGGKTE